MFLILRAVVWYRLAGHRTEFIMEHVTPLEYQSKERRSRAGRVVLPLVLLAVVGGLILALHELAIMPYRPPYDMSTFLGGPEEELVSLLMALLAVVWVGLVIWCVTRFRSSKSAA
jgi:hypothetical protein